MNTIEKLKQQYHRDTIADLVQAINEKYDEASFRDDEDQMDIYHFDLEVIAKELNIPVNELYML